MPKGKSKSKEKGKGKDKKGKKGKQKEKKVKAKWAMLEYEGQRLGLMDVYDLHVIADNIRSDLIELRSDRILFQMERDYFSELIVMYLEKIRDARDIPKLMRTLQNAMVDEKNYIKGGYTDKLMSNLDFEVSINVAASNMREYLRRKKMRKRIEDAWRSILDEIDELERLAKLHITKRNQKITELAEELDNLNEYIERAKQKQKEFLQTLKSNLRKLNQDLRKVDELDKDYVELHYNQVIYEFLNMLSWRYFQFRQTANENVHNILTGIMLLIDHWDNLEVDCKFMTQNIELYNQDIDGMVGRNDEIKSTLRATNAKHRQLLSLQRALKVSYRCLRESEDELKEADAKYKSLLDTFTPMDEERVILRAKLPVLTEDLWETYQERYKIEDTKAKTTQAVSRNDTVRTTLQSLHESPGQADFAFNNLRFQMEDIDEYVQQQKFRSLRIMKQHDDMNRSVRARVRDIGHRGWIANCPPRPELIGLAHGMKSAPAGLVAKRAFAPWGTIDRSNCKKCPPSPPPPETPCYPLDEYDYAR